MPSHNGPWHVLVVEDHQPTARLITIAFDEIDADVTTHVVQDGSECLAVVQGDVNSIPVPDLILLDLDLQEVHGLDVLEARIEDPSLLRIPTIVLSGKDDPDSIERCYESGASAYFTKPDDFDEYLDVIRAIVNVYFVTGKLSRNTTDVKP